MDLTNDKNHIVIYADELYIGEIDFGQHNTLEIHPFTPGHEVNVYIRQVKFSSSSSIIMDSGNYHIKDVDIPGSGEKDVLFKASDENQIINLILDPASENHDFEIGSNYGINSNGTGGNFGNYNPANFRIFVNGDMDIGNGGSNTGTTINALIYVTGEVNIGTHTYVRGAISSYDDITIKDGSKFYWDERIDFSNYGKCVNYQNKYVCGIFPTPLNSYTHITINGNNSQVCFTTNIAYPEGELEGNIKCSPQGCDNEKIICKRIDPPLNKYTYTFPINKRSGIEEDSSITELTEEYYGNFKFYHKLIHFNPQFTYDDNDNIKVMILGNVKSEKSTLKFEPGDYFFNSLEIKNNNNKIILPNGGPVRIFIKKDFNVSLNNFQLNREGNASDLFIYVGGNFNSLSNGGGTTTLKGFIYVKGNTYLKNNSNNWKIYGSLTTEGNIIIEGNNPDFIGGINADNLGYGKCSMCYDTPKINGVSFSIGSCPGFSIDMFSKIYVPIQSSDSLENVVIDEAHKKSLFSFNMFNANEVRDQDGNYVRDADQSNNGLVNVSILGLDASLFDNKIVSYVLGDDEGIYGPTSSNNYQQLYTSTLFSFDFCKWYESLTYVAHYEKNGKHYDTLIGPCLENNEERYEVGPFDAWDENRNILDRNITTKIVNKKFNLIIASINPDNNATEIVINKNCKYRLYDMDNDINLTSWREFNATKATKKDYFIITKAVKNVRIQFKFCQKRNEYPIVIVPLSKCNDTSTSSDYEFNISTFSSDNFAIRPYKFKILPNTDLKKAGNEFNLKVEVVDFNNKIINNFNDNVYYSIENVKDLKGCNAGKLSPLNGSLNFVNGEANLALKYEEVGDINITMGEESSNEFAEVDRDDSNDTLRLIENDTNISTNFIPDHFDIAARYSNYNGGNFTYISNDLSMSSELNITVTAKNKQNITTKNYNKACYAKNTDLNISYTQNGNINTLLLTKLVANTEKRDKNLSINGLIIEKNLSKNIFNTDNNGSANIKIYINFKKNYSNPINKFNMVINDINISDINGTFGNKNVGENGLFEYGKIDVKNVATIDKNEINSTIYYEYWDSNKGWVINADHNSTYGDINKSKSLISPSGISEFNLDDIKNGEENVTIKTNHALPYSTKIHLSIPSWLWYHPLAKEYKDPSSSNLDCLTHPCMRVEFREENKGWGGIGNKSSKYSETNRTVEINATNSKIKANKKQVEKLNW